MTFGGPVALSVPILASPLDKKSETSKNEQILFCHSGLHLAEGNRIAE